MKKATRYFLPRANFGKGPIALGIEINLERFLIRPDIHLGFHNFQDVGIYGLLNRRVSDPKMARPYSNSVIPSGCEGPRSRSGVARTIGRSFAVCAAQDDTRGGNSLALAPARARRSVVPEEETVTAAVTSGSYNRTLSTAFAAIHPR